MTMTTTQAIIMIAAVVAGTMTTRFLPFFIFPANKPTPAYILYLGKVLPYAVIGLLVVYCLKDVSFTYAPYGLAEILSIALIVVLHCWKRNMLISIACGTLFYMFLVQSVFI